MCCGTCAHMSALKTASSVSNLEIILAFYGATVCGPAVLALFVVLWVALELYSEIGLYLMGMGIEVAFGHAANSHLVQVSGFLSAADATHTNHWVRFDRFASKQICYIQSL